MIDSNLSRLASKSCSLCLAVAIQSAFFPSVASAEVVNSASDQSESIGWNGYSRNFAEYWSGDTKRVDWRRPGGSSSGIIWSGGGTLGSSSIDFDFTPTKPIELVDSYRAIETDTMSHISVPGDSVVAEEDGRQFFSEPGNWYRVNAHYATVLDLDDIEVGHSSAIAALDSNVEDDAFQLSAFQHAITEIDSVVDDWSTVSAASDVEFTASYQLNEPSHLEFKGNFSGAVEMNVLFTLTARESGEIYYEQSLDRFDYRGEQIDFSYRGDFVPGIYDVSFSSSAYSSLDGAGNFDASGIGEFTLDFQASSLLTGDFNGSRATNGEDLGVWQNNYGKFGNQLNSIEDVFKAYENDSDWQANHAEDYNDDDRIDFFDYLIWLNLRVDGDADGDNDSDGTDFLAWQQNSLSLDEVDLADWKTAYVLGLTTADFDNDGETDGGDFLTRQAAQHAAQASFSQVPEPSSALVLLVAIGCYAVRLR